VAFRDKQKKRFAHMRFNMTLRVPLSQPVVSPRPMDLDNVQFPVPMEVVQREFEGALADIAQSEAAGNRSLATGGPTIEAVVPAPATLEQLREDHASSTVPASAAVTENQLATPVSSTFIAASAHGLTLPDLNLVVRGTGVEPYVPPFVTPSAPTRAYQPTTMSRSQDIARHPVPVMHLLPRPQRFLDRHCRPIASGNEVVRLDPRRRSTVTAGTRFDVARFVRTVTAPNVVPSRLHVG